MASYVDPGGFRTISNEPPHETQKFVSVRNLEGSPVYSETGERLGRVHDIMIEKQSGRVAYTVLAMGGLFGLGWRPHPVMWSELTPILEAVDLEH